METYQRIQHFPYHPWEITETEFHPEDFRRNEAIFSLANGYLGQRCSFEEGVSGVENLVGNYIAGVFDSYPTATMVKLKGRPANPSQMVNTPDYLPLHIIVDGEPVDLAEARIEEYRRTLHMDRGVLTREFVCALSSGRRIRVAFTRFLSRARKHIAAMRVTITPLSGDMVIGLTSRINGDVRNLGHRHLTNVKLYQPECEGIHGLTCRTEHTGIDIAVLASYLLSGGMADTCVGLDWQDRQTRQRITVPCEMGQTLMFDRIVAVATSRDLDIAGAPRLACERLLEDATAQGFDALLAEHEAVWREIWRTVNIEIIEKNDSSELTQGLHYSLFQMIQNASDDDYTVNLGAKGLTGEHYFGTYFWDTEVFMLPLFAFTMPHIARNLVRFRAHTLPGARRKAREEMDLAGAVYPWMGDANGDESCTLWQFNLLAIHVTADVAWGIWLYYCATGDLDFIAEYGIDVMVETSRAWLSRAFYRRDIDRYVINRVLGPDEYHQGVDNNYYTNLMAQANLLKTVTLLDLLRAERPAAYAAAATRLGLGEDEAARFGGVGENIFLPRDDARGINLQDDRFHLLEPYDLRAHPPGGPIVSVWSYDRLMRTQLLRQGDIVVAHVLQGDQFTPEQMARDFRYYEPITTHDSSLSFCSHSIVAAQLNDAPMAYDYFLRTARLDLDDSHGNTWMGIHAASLAGAWQCVVFGFGGVRWYDGTLSLAPLLPAQWEQFSFTIAWHGARIAVTVRAGEVELATDGAEVAAMLRGEAIVIGATARVFACPARECTV